VTEPADPQHMALLRLLVKLNADIAELQKTAKSLHEVLGLDVDSPEALAIRCLLEAGTDKRILAIKNYRAQAGASLHTAKDAIDVAYETVTGRPAVYRP
jgi:ribosomal protein L7/L12